MDVETSKDKPACQLQVVQHACGPLTLLDKVRNMSKRLSSALRRRLQKFSPHNAACQSNVNPTNQTGSSAYPDKGSLSLQAGDLVEILSYQEILGTLDGKGRCEGLEFMPGMERYTGQRFTVFKIVRSMFDERAWKMVRIKNTVILKNVICDGHGMYDKEGCDRCCFYFWKERWLRNLK